MQVVPITLIIWPTPGSTKYTSVSTGNLPPNSHVLRHEAAQDCSSAATALEPSWHLRYPRGNTMHLRGRDRGRIVILLKGQCLDQAMLKSCAFAYAKITPPSTVF